MYARLRASEVMGPGMYVPTGIWKNPCGFGTYAQNPATRNFEKSRGGGDQETFGACGCVAFSSVSAGFGLQVLSVRIPGSI